jgi:hypothetical protein
MGSLVYYYVHQRGGVNSGHSNEFFGCWYVGVPYVPRGEGIGSFLAGIIRALEPLGIRG